MKERTGVVVSVRVYWQRDGTGQPRRRQRIRVEYPDGTDTRLVMGESGLRREVRPGDHVTVMLRPGRPAAIMPIPEERPGRSTARVRSGLAAFAGLIALVLLLSGGIWLRATSGPERYPPPGPPASPPVESASVGPSVSGSTGR